MDHTSTIESSHHTYQTYVSPPPSDNDERSDGTEKWPKITIPAVQPTKLASIPSPTRLSSHKRAGSGGLLSRFLFSRTTDQDAGVNSGEGEALPPQSKTSIDDEGGSPLSPEHEFNDIPKARSVKQRKRKGSLRKVALLGGRRFAGEVSERRNSLLQRTPVKILTQESDAVAPYARDSQRADKAQLGPEDNVRVGYDQTLSGESATLSADTPAVTAARLSLLTAQTTAGVQAHAKHPSDTSAATLSSPSDPKSPNSYASTTEDDDDGLSFSRPSTSGLSIISSEATYPPPLPVSTSTSYFQAPIRALRPRSQHRVRPSPLQNALAPAPELYSYAETEYWGWVILFVTWLSFTVGMGSCLDIWSWAWDVGETPYAPPELEDDPTLPIVGYYPALIVLTGVVAWVWITVAWIGMKYFRHAKIEV